MIVLRCFRPDRVTYSIKNFVKLGMGNSDFITSNPTSIADIFEDSVANVPIIFVLTVGVDPTELLMRFAAERNQTVATLSLGKGQGAKATEILNKAAESG